MIRSNGTMRRWVLIAMTLAIGTAALGTPAAAAGQVDLGPASTRSQLTARAAAVVNTASRAAVEDAYLKTFLPSTSVAPVWNGSVAPCGPGTGSPTGDAATLTAVNYMRGMAGLQSVTFDPAYSTQARAAALISDATGTLSHTPSTGSACYTADGSAGSGKSNLHIRFGYSAAPYALAVDSYMRDAGTGNTAVGHRRWILAPGTKKMGTGTTTRANALYVIDGQTAFNTPAGSPEWVAWPTAGYFPAPLEPAGRWSLTATNLPGTPDDDVSFASAQVSVRDAGGRALTVTRYPPSRIYDSRTLAWDVAGLTPPVGRAEASYSVTVTGIVKAGTTISRSYPVTLVNPGAPYFIDVSSSHPFFVPIEWMASTGLSTGTTTPAGREYRPALNVSWQAMAAFLHRYSAETFVPPTVPSFIDVPKTNTFYPAVEWMKATGITAGTDNNNGTFSFQPGRAVSRDSMAVFLYRYALHRNPALTYTPPATPSFNDVPKAAPTYKEIEWMVANGITTGFVDGGYHPSVDVSRQATAAFLQRFDTKFGG